MNILVNDDYASMSQQAAAIIEAHICNHERTVLGLATGSTPLGMYEALIEGHQTRGVSFKRTFTLNLDEYIGLQPSHPQSYHYYMQHHLFSKIDIPLHQTYLPNGTAQSLSDECSRYEQIIDEVGPPDIQVLGIGENGHIGFNEPGSDFSGTTHVIDLAPSTLKANARFFHTVDEVPNKAITMGIQSILKSKRILLLASGENKAWAVKKLMEKIIDDQFPASALHHHPDVTLVIDQKAYSQIQSDRG
ncbi:glucosamine-6-phosphate deaminase [Jeotgalibacillus proteolyticus]|uniref:glucosamine-6-phosphate deaminase n=1 Tax=Jeotgalibacillus proteolyticus TaxID=2082395 RepID=UPI003CE91DA8